MAQIKFKTHLKCILLASILLSGCQTAFEEDQTRRSKITQFALNHPVAAQAIGMEDTGSFNISSNATRFAYRSGLDDTANGDGKGTQVNAVRQALWQAAITSQFDNVIAEEAGNAYLADIKIREGKINYFSRYLADQAVDQRNNRIGRSIGSGRPNTDMKALAESVLLYYHKIGLWTASETRTNRPQSMAHYARKTQSYCLPRSHEKYRAVGCRRLARGRAQYAQTRQNRLDFQNG